MPYFVVIILKILMRFMTTTSDISASCNKEIANVLKDKKKLKKENEVLAKKFDAMSKAKGLSEAEALKFENEAEELREAHLTETEKLEGKYKRELAAEKVARETAEGESSKNKITLARRVISEETLKAANELGALKPGHILGLLPNQPKYEDGKVTVEVDGKDLPIKEAVEAMKKDVDNYGIYFGNKKVKGQGGKPNEDDNDDVKMTVDDVDSPEAYDKYLEEQKSPETIAAEKEAAEKAKKE
jgi:hypothetical protein